MYPFAMQQRMMQLNIPMTSEGYVSIAATLFSIVIWSHPGVGRNFREFLFTEVLRRHLAFSDYFHFTLLSLESKDVSRESKIQRLRDIFPRVQKRKIEDLIPICSG